ncbi:extensin-1 isoform X2 [Eurytemora carolleeae]|uniref:extensin-1 isoform X2 n=1 Tax=Eurytemora carolleeae TaxID=1294199 RepID=UPI000C788E94|nr:extensin-1 isoform X2 [Eurytemora carolleeae]|eukprot:XP_023331925.1 extensin-1-like isoform X2 [Eurytemora affinis]
MKGSSTTALLLGWIFVVASSDPAYNRNTRRAIPLELYRDSVEPAKGGKIPESAHMRHELNLLDAAGLEGGEGQHMMEHLIDNPPSLDLPSSTYSGYSPPLKLKPAYVPESESKDPYDSSPYSAQPYEPNPYAPAPYVPEPYAPAPYEPAPYKPSSSYEPAAYAPPKPEYHAPVGPVLLEKRPYEVESVKPLPITVSETYTSFDCRKVPYPDRHYADPEAGCEIYHFCHADGKQDSFHCGYGTIFNEYIGTCDYKNNVHCGAEKSAGYAPAPASYAPAPYAPPKASYTPAPAPYAPAHNSFQDSFNDFKSFGFNK